MVSASKLNVEVLNGFQKLGCDKPTDEQGQDMREFLLSFYPREAAKVCVTAFQSDLDASGLHFHPNYNLTSYTTDIHVDSYAAVDDM